MIAYSPVELRHHMPEEAADQLDTRGMMRLVGAIVVQAANDYVTSRDFDAAVFLSDAGVLHRAAEIVRFAPSNTAKTKAQRALIAR